VIVAGHHRFAAFMNVYKVLKRCPKYHCTILDETDDDFSKNECNIAINTCEVSAVPDYFSVLFETMLSTERLR
jgi:hypothetical protein